MSHLKWVGALGVLVLLGACGETVEKRAASGGLSGAAAGALVGGPVGAAIGGAAGATGGAAMDEGAVEKVEDAVDGPEGEADDAAQ